MDRRTSNAIHLVDIQPSAPARRRRAGPTVRYQLPGGEILELAACILLVVAAGCMAQAPAIPRPTPVPEPVRLAAPLQGPYAFTPTTARTYRGAVWSNPDAVKIEAWVEEFRDDGRAVYFTVAARFALGPLGTTKRWAMRASETGLEGDGKFLLPASPAGSHWWNAGDGSARLVGREAVETPAGRFENCFKIDFVGEDAKLSTLWLAPGSGVVRADFPFMFGRGSAWLETATE